MSMIDEMRALERAATPGPWEADENEVYAPCPCCGLIATTHIVAGKGDALFIALARQYVPWSVDMIDSLTNRNQRLDCECQKYFEHWQEAYSENLKLTKERDAAVEVAKELRDDFVDYALSGVPNLAPYCGNGSESCIDGRGWCMEQEFCKGFQPKAWRGMEDG